MFPEVPAAVLNYPVPPQVAATVKLSPDRRAALRNELGARPQDVVILQASRPERWKGPDLVLRALARLRDLPNWRFWLAGGAQRNQEVAYFRELKGLASDLGIADRVVLLGQRTDVSTLMRASDLYCQGNRGPEGFSLSFLEACYSGLPVVTSDLGGAPEMIDDSCGVLVPPEDLQLLADGLRRLITNSDLRSALSVAARQQAIRLCDTKQQIRRLHGMFAELVSPTDAREDAGTQLIVS
jgi:glycosyltransferase involved in cell wall biosynthesis